MQFGNAVDREGADDGQVGHADNLVVAFAADNRNLAEFFGIVAEFFAGVVHKAAVDFVNNLQMARQNFADNARRPGFKRLRQQRMVGVGENLGRNFPGGIPFLTVNVHQQAHHLGNGQRRVRVVQLADDVIRHFGKVVALFEETADNVLNGAGNKEILLNKAQRLARFNCVGRIQHFRNGFGLDFFLNRFHIAALVENVDVQLVVGLGREQPQIVDRFAVIADNRKIVRYAVELLGVHPDEAVLSGCGLEVFDFAVNRNFDRAVRPGKLPRRVFAEPTVGLLNLIAVFKFLLKQAELIVDAVAETRNAERRHRVQIAGCQTSQAAVAQRRIIFGVENFLQGDVRHAVDFDAFQNVEQAEVVQVVFQRAADEILD